MATGDRADSSGEPQIVGDYPGYFAETCVERIATITTLQFL
jgi:hypothetical protein